MIPLSELKDLYDGKLQPSLLKLEGVRKQVKKRFIQSGLSFVAAIGGFIGASNFSSSIVMLFLAITFGSFVLAIVSIFKATKQKKEYRTAYKKEIVWAIMQSVYPDWIYNHNAHISEAEYVKSDLFSKDYDRFSGDDLVVGKVQNTDFRSSELHTEYKTESRDSNGNSRTEWHTIFRGLFFHADFHKHFNGKTYVKTDTLEGWFGSFGNKIQRFIGPAKFAKLENPEFEKHFVVHSTDQTEARYILTPTMMEAMVRLKVVHGLKVQFSFIDTRVYCAISFTNSLFEPSVFKSGIQFRDVKAVYDLLKINELIINELDLNTRIWTKS